MSSDDSTVPNGFRQIPGFPRYAIDENGTVLSICVSCSRRTITSWADAKRIFLRKDKGGYLQVTLHHDRIKQTVKVHRLVLTTFVGTCPTGMECRHIDGNPANNHVFNLAWGTEKQNGADKVLHGTSGKGEKCGKSKLTDADVLEIRRRAENGEKRRSIAKHFHIVQSNITAIVLRQTWKHI